MTQPKEVKKKQIVIICGPTAVGKTSAAIKIAKIFNGEIISADSRQIYRYMDIGTAKPTPKELAEIPHHLVGFINPDQHFDANQFAILANETIRKLLNKKKLPMLVGGTGLYIKSTLHGFFTQKPFDPAVRLKLNQEVKTYGKHYIYEKLQIIDPETAHRLHPNDTYRIIRALEVYETSGKPISTFHREHGFAKTRYHALKIGLNLDRELLYKHIDQRVDMMISEGLIEEVQQLIHHGYSPDSRAMKAIGYHHFVAYLTGTCSLENAVDKLKRDTRRYAKRQMTWFRADPDIIWVKPLEIKSMISMVSEFIERKLN